MKYDELAESAIDFLQKPKKRLALGREMKGKCSEQCKNCASLKRR